MKFLKAAAIALVALALSAPAQAAVDNGYRDAITVIDNDIAITFQARDHIIDAGLITVLYQAASSPVFDGDGAQVGYLLSDIEPGSVYETVGLKDFDLVTDIDGIQLTDPRTAVEAMRYAKTLDDFTVTVWRAGEKLRLRVRVK